METVPGRFEQVLALLTVVDAGGFTAAAARLGVSKAFVSKQVSTLEAALGVRLLQRTTRRVAPTEAGRLYLDYVRQARGLLEDGERAVSAVRTQVDGVLRITAPTSFGDGLIVDLVAAFRAVHPEVRFDIDLSIGTRDLIADGYDFALRMSRTLDPSLIARPVGAVRERIIASPSLVARCAPQGVHQPRQLEAFEVLRNNHFRDEGQWVLDRDGERAQVPVRGSLAINSYMGMRRAAIQGLGVARLPGYLVAEHVAAGDLVELLPDWRLPSTPLSLVYPSREHLPLRSRLFRDFAIEWLTDSRRAALLA